MKLPVVNFQEEISKIDEYCKKYDVDRDGVLTNDLEEVLEDRGQWYDCDDLGHFMGGNLGCKLYVTIDDEEYDVLYDIFDPRNTEADCDSSRFLILHQ